MAPPDVDRFALARLLTTQPTWWTYPNYNTGVLQVYLQNHTYFKEQINATYVRAAHQNWQEAPDRPGVRYEFSREFGVGPSILATGKRNAASPAAPRARSTPPARPILSPVTVPASGPVATITALGCATSRHVQYQPRILTSALPTTKALRRPDITNLVPGISGINETNTP